MSHSNAWVFSRPEADTLPVMDAVKRNVRFSLYLNFQWLRPSKMAVHPCAVNGATQKLLFWMGTNQA